MEKLISKYFFEKPPLEKVIEEFLPLINYWANRYAYYGNPVLNKEDLVSAGVIGLIEAYHRYDPSKNVRFKTYAEFRIKGAMLDEIRKLDIIPRSVKSKINDFEEKLRKLYQELGRMPKDEEIAEFMEITLEEYYKFLESIKGITFIDIESFKQRFPELEEENLFDFLAKVDEKEDPFERYALKELQEKLEKALECLSEKERLVLALYYYEGLTMKEIAKILDYTESRISQIHNKAILKLRSILNK
ncbi:MAG: FliA/WhiG family RNA polymerase sigma factor [Thermodesulfobacterium geofontis]|uniref:FliA/WhiG family RNA polymerase sigma factor n=1 Tax=Thermodesulfobacterium geofontis TaxID=1295609 RepID=A0A2N7QFR2_9BACT|nr:MAG: FliA/WhiG family RNA polymerase sigma factor [Thermodesulfobacterium geofontis]PMP97718.1 MAG: FliA/WhiG family RNA polymerase sigma factor [Thermodesulfobacterium geofontis]